MQEMGCLFALLLLSVLCCCIVFFLLIMIGICLYMFVSCVCVCVCVFMFQCVCLFVGVFVNAHPRVPFLHLYILSIRTFLHFFYSKMETSVHGMVFEHIFFQSLVRTHDFLSHSTGFARACVREYVPELLLKKGREMYHCP